jgi:hypothetical protein
VSDPPADPSTASTGCGADRPAAPRRRETVGLAGRR